MIGDVSLCGESLHETRHQKLGLAVLPGVFGGDWRLVICLRGEYFTNYGADWSLISWDKLLGHLD